MLPLLVRVGSFIVGCCALYIAAFMYPSESGRLQSRVMELWVGISDRARFVGSRTVALFNAVAAADTRLLNRIYGMKLISFRMVGISTITSLAMTMLFMVAANPFSAQINAPPLTPDTKWFVWMVLGILAVLTAPAFLTSSRFAVALTLLPVSFFVSFWILTVLIHDPHGGWSNVLTTAILVSLLSDVVVTALIRSSIEMIGRQVKMSMIVAMLCVQALCIPVFSGVPPTVGYILDRPHTIGHHTDAVSTLYFITIMNTTTVFLSLAFIASMAFVVLHRVFWPVLERVFYPVADLEILRNRKLMGGIGVVCLAHAFHLTSGLLKALLETAAK